MIKNLPASAGDAGLNPGSGRSPREGNGNPLQYFCLENSVDRGAWQAIVHGLAESDMTERLHFPVQGDLDPTCCGAAKPVCLNY